MGLFVHLQQWKLQRALHLRIGSCIDLLPDLYIVIFVAKGSKEKTEELPGVTKCCMFYGEQSFLKMN